ncbi:hypothetical protein [Aquamicrobium ahrensii]|uniref:Uncharacterized protein n=1 Tax=Aquamicrobium ahrensii TaxID=469551 RepID=A0ABV2KN63_9HYPH
MQDIKQKLHQITGSLDQPSAHIGTLIDDAVEGDLHSAMGLLATILPGWSIGDGLDQPVGRIVAKLYSPTGSIVEGEGSTFAGAVLEAIVRSAE